MLFFSLTQETADEGVGVGVDNENTSSSADHGGKSNANNVGGEREKVMADVIGGLIEFQLNKPSQVPGLSQVRFVLRLFSTNVNIL